jgi:hypothetical protein
MEMSELVSRSLVAHSMVYRKQANRHRREFDWEVGDEL